MSADWLKSKTKSVLADVTITVTGRRAQESEDVPIQLHIVAIELNYGPCISFKARVDVAMEHKGWYWDDHPFRGALKDSDKDDPDCTTKNDEGVTCVLEVADIVDDTPAVRALITELSQAVAPKLYCGTDCTHRARLISAIRSFWA